VATTESFLGSVVATISLAGGRSCAGTKKKHHARFSVLFGRTIILWYPDPGSVCSLAKPPLHTIESWVVPESHKIVSLNPGHFTYPETQQARCLRSQEHSTYLPDIFRTRSKETQA
jgi:hypothetical protein